MYGVKTSVDHPSWLIAELGSSYASRQMHVIHLANTPTPVQRLRLIEPLLPARDLNMELWIKRDDFTGSELSGNKVRKLEFILADAVEQGCDTVVTIGGIQSNHCRATVAAANSLGLEAHVVLRTSRLAVDQDPGATGNLLVSRLANAHVHLVSKEEYARHGQKELGRRVVEELRAAGKKPYLIVVGGSSVRMNSFWTMECTLAPGRRLHALTLSLTLPHSRSSPLIRSPGTWNLRLHEHDRRAGPTAGSRKGGGV